MVEVRSVPCMNAGNEATSYANNSLLQKTVILKARLVLEETINDILMSTEVNWDPSDETFVFNKYESGENVANCIRAVSEPMLATHIGENIIDILFTRYAHHVADHLAVEKTKFINIVVSMTKIN
ncbi:hypothetical protein QYF36_021319 [Acer negundo]|nr:hypothetical protein QYF36_021319 [Acer negundo]